MPCVSAATTTEDPGSLNSQMFAPCSVWPCASPGSPRARVRQAAGHRALLNDAAGPVSRGDFSCRRNAAPDNCGAPGCGAHNGGPCQREPGQWGPSAISLRAMRGPQPVFVYLFWVTDGIFLIVVYTHKKQAIAISKKV